MTTQRYELWWELTGGQEVQHPKRTIVAAELAKWLDQAAARDGVWADLDGSGWHRRHTVAGYRLKEVGK